MSLMDKLQELMKEANSKLASDDGDAGTHARASEVDEYGDDSILKTAESVLSEIDRALNSLPDGDYTKTASSANVVDEPSDMKKAATLAVLLRGIEDDVSSMTGASYRDAYMRLDSVRKTAGLGRGTIIGALGALGGIGGGYGYAKYKEKKLKNEFARALQEDEENDQQNLIRAYYYGYNSALDGAQ